MRRKPKSEPVDQTPEMPRGATEFEEKRIACEFTLLMNRIQKMSFATFTDSCNYIFRHGYFTGKIGKERERGISPKLPSYIQIL